MQDTLECNQALRTLASSVGLSINLLLSDRNKWQVWEDDEMLGLYNRTDLLLAIIARA